MRLPPGPAAAAVHLVARGLGATWSWRGAREPSGAGGAATPGTDGAGPGEPAAGTAGAWRAVRPPAALAPAVYVAWHEHLLPLALLHREQGVRALVSRHRDGEILARVLDRLGYRTVRGSSTRGGGPGLRRMIEAGRSGETLAFTPDGPRGPARRCKPGAVRAAAETGLPVVPLAAAATSARRLGSWDRFLVPAPAARVYVARGDGIPVPPGAAGGAGTPESDGAPGGDDPPTAWTDRVERALEAARRRAERAAEARA